MLCRALLVYKQITCSVRRYVVVIGVRHTHEYCKKYYLFINLQTRVWYVYKEAGNKYVSLARLIVYGLLKQTRAWHSKIVSDLQRGIKLQCELWSVTGDIMEIKNDTKWSDRHRNIFIEGRSNDTTCWRISQKIVRNATRLVSRTFAFLFQLLRLIIYKLQIRMNIK